jgi:hypothetical protein
MLDVHPPHSPTHTWKDFFIHIATIVIGLLIAVGLEQTVEYLHHRNQIAETREALRIEREQNRLHFALSNKEFHRQLAATQDNLTAMVYLQQHPGTPTANLPQPVVWHLFSQSFNVSAWQTAQQSAVTTLMPTDEVRRDADFYHYIDRVIAAERSVSDAVTAARRYTFQDSDVAHLSPAQVAEQLDLTRTVLMRIYIEGQVMRNLGLDHPDFQPTPTTSELLAMMHEPKPDGLQQQIEQYLKEQRQADELIAASPSSAIR